MDPIGCYVLKLKGIFTQCLCSLAAPAGCEVVDDKYHLHLHGVQLEGDDGESKLNTCCFPKTGGEKEQEFDLKAAGEKILHMRGRESFLEQLQRKL